METGREFERRRGGQSQTRRWQTKAAREKEGKDVQWEGERARQTGKRGRKKSGWKFTACLKRKERKFLSRKPDGKAKCTQGFSSCAAENTHLTSGIRITC